MSLHLGGLLFKPPFRPASIARSRLFLKFPEESFPPLRPSSTALTGSFLKLPPDRLPPALRPSRSSSSGTRPSHLASQLIAKFAHRNLVGQTECGLKMLSPRAWKPVWRRAIQLFTSKPAASTKKACGDYDECSRRESMPCQTATELQYNAARDCFSFLGRDERRLARLGCNRGSTGLLSQS